MPDLHGGGYAGENASENAWRRLGYAKITTDH
jgi:hypothetical protein